MTNMREIIEEQRRLQEQRVEILLQRRRAQEILQIQREIINQYVTPSIGYLRVGSSAEVIQNWYRVRRFMRGLDEELEEINRRIIRNYGNILRRERTHRRR